MLSNQTMSLPPDWIAAAGAAGASLTATGDKAVFPIPCKCVVDSVGVVVTTTCAGATTTPVVDFDLRPTAGSDTGRGTGGDVAHLVLGTAAGGKVMYDRAAEGLVLTPGQEVVVECATAATGGTPTGTCRPFLVVRPVAEEPVNLTKMVETA